MGSIQKSTALGLCLLITGCSTVKVQDTPTVCSEAVTPAPAELAPIHWAPVRYEGQWLMALDPVGIDALQLNLLALKRYIEQVKQEKEYYKQCLQKDHHTS